MNILVCLKQILDPEIPARERNTVAVISALQALAALCGMYSVATRFALAPG